MLRYCLTFIQQELLKAIDASGLTYYTFRTRVDYTDKQETDREPSFCVRHIEISERDDTQFLHGHNTSYANRGLDSKE